jgi:hypothetical protein
MLVEANKALRRKVQLDSKYFVLNILKCSFLSVSVYVTHLHSLVLYFFKKGKKKKNKNKKRKNRVNSRKLTLENAK